MSHRGGIGIVAALSLLWGCQAELAHDLSEAEANRVASVLSEHGIAAEVRGAGSLRDRTWTVAVPATESAQARLLLDRSELPAQPEDGLAEVFDRGGIVPTPTEEQARLTRAIQGELAQTLESVDGVVAARVHVSLPGTPRGPLSSAASVQARASVLIRHAGPTPPLSEAEVRGIVSGAISELEPGLVTVVTLSAPAPRATAGASIVALGPFTVSSASHGPLSVALATIIGMAGALAAALVVLAFRLRSMRRRLSALERQVAGSDE